MSARFAWILSLSLLLSSAALAQSSIKHESLFQIGDLEFTETQLFQQRLEEHAGDTNTVATGQDLEDKAYRIAEVMHLNRFFGVEGALSYLRTSYASAYKLSEIAEGAGQRTDYDMSVRYASFELFAHGSVPVWKDYILVYGKVGGSYTRSEYELNKTVTNLADNTSTKTDINEDVDTFDLAYGYGVLGVISSTIVLRVDYTKFKVDHMEAETTSFGIGFRY